MKSILYFLVLMSFSGLQIAAEKMGSAEIEEMKQQLQMINERNAFQKEQIVRQRKEKQKLEKLVECIWNMLQGYENCETQFDKASEGYLACLNEAKSKNEVCTETVKTAQTP